MIRHVWSVLCRQAFLEPTTNETALTVLEAFSLPNANQERALVGGAFHLASLWHCDPGSADFAYLVKVTGPSGEALADVEVVVTEFVAPSLGARSRADFPGVQYDGLGVYWFRVMRLVDGQEILDAEIPLHIA